MPTVIDAGAPGILIEALTANLHAHVPLYSRLPGAMVCAIPNVLGLLTALDITENCVYRANFTPENAPQQIERVMQQYREQDCLPMYWQVGPTTLPVDLGQDLLACGFTFLIRAPGMAADLYPLEEPVVPGNFGIEPVQTNAQLRQWVNIIAKVDEISDALHEGFYQMFAALGFEAGNNSQLFLGVENVQPVAASRLLCTGEVAGIWHVATLPEARGRGYGTAMTLEAAGAGRDRGYRFGILYATPTGYGLYRRLGFQEYCHLDIYKSPE